MTGLHQLLLDNVLNLLDMYERLAGIPHPLRHRLGNQHRRRAVFLLRKERLANRDLNFVFIPTDNLAVAADQPDADFFVRLGHVAGRVNHQAAGHVMRVVFDQHPLDAAVQIRLGQP